MHNSTIVLTLENMEPISCMVAKVFGGSLASIPSNALDRDTIRRSMRASAVSRSLVCWAAETEERSRARPAYATDVTAVFSWWVAVICSKKKENQEGKRKAERFGGKNMYI